MVCSRLLVCIQGKTLNVSLGATYIVVLSILVAVNIRFNVKIPFTDSLISLELSLLNPLSSLVEVNLFSRIQALLQRTTDLYSLHGP